MKILVVGSGGREHALVWKLASSSHAQAIWCAPGNAGIAQERLAANGSRVEVVPISAGDIPALAGFAEEKRVDLTVVGPDNPLAAGIVDTFEQRGLRAWGPNRRAAQFEASKVFSQQFMERHGIPTARSGVFEDASKAHAFAASLDGRCAVKADGLALGKGVLMCENMAEADTAIDDVLVKKAFGAAGAKVVIQEYLEGTEVSLHALCDGKTALLFPTSQDHKRALEGDRGLNTGGMGTFSPTPFLGAAGIAEARRKIFEPWLAGCSSEGLDYRGILYPGVMVTPSGPKVLEFNARFGDPETQVYMARLESDLVELLAASADGTLAGQDCNWSKLHAVCVVMASGGYPGEYSKGKVIEGLPEVDKLSDVKVFHAGTTLRDGKTFTNGGRVLGVTARADSLEGARKKAYSALEIIRFEGAQFRRDIGSKAFARGTPAPMESWV